MRAPTVRRILAFIVLALALLPGLMRLGPVPALGPLLHPTTGLWAVAAQRDFPSMLTPHVPGMEDSVTVVVDQRAVPHIFARTRDDAYRALGYVVARERLFQMELQTRAAAGRLSEWLGRRALPLDRAQRRLGLASSAERAYRTLDTASVTAHELRAYAEGVNARIAELTQRDLPLEYRLIGAGPMPWKPVYSLYLWRRFGYTLAYSRSDLQYARLEQLIGLEAAAAIWPPNSPIQEPIVPNGEDEPRFEFRTVPGPAGAGKAEGPEGEGSGAASASGQQGDEGADIGSNNWAVAPARSASHAALLAGDPHLGLTLPSVWYEAQLQVTGPAPAPPSPSSEAGSDAGLDVYGVTIPGEPFVVIGFNRDVAWSFTNGNDDVVDWYAEAVDDTVHPTSYRVDGTWHRLNQRVEVYRDRRGNVLATDTILATHRGPLTKEDGRWLSMRWTVLEDTTTVAVQGKLSDATSVSDWLRTYAGWQSPAQNGMVADRDGNIAVLQAGRFPARPGNGSGVPIRDGSTRASDWVGELPPARYPFAENPAQGFLASANQQPLDPLADSTYLGSDWDWGKPGPWRAMRINALLRGDSAVTPDDMRRFQTDPGSARADLFVPAFLRAAEHWTGSGRASTRTVQEAARLLAQWDRRYTKANTRAVLFEAAMRELSRRAWDELALPDSGSSGRARWTFLPGDAVLAELLHDSASVWWDDRGTKDHVETETEILATSLGAAYDSVVARHGPPDGDGWRWARIRHENIYHLLGFPSLSALGIAVDGGPGTLNPSQGTGRNGPSWRMVVELGPEVRAWSIYPGGQSGNPASRWYDDRIAKWANGELDPVLFPRRPGGLEPPQVIGRMVIAPATETSR